MSIESAVTSRNIFEPESNVKPLVFIRHGHYDPENKAGVEGSGLTQIGLDEARSLHRQLPGSPDRMKVYSANNLRSLGTIALAMFPELQPSEAMRQLERLTTESKVRIVPGLDYLPIKSDILERKLTDVYNAGSNLSFLVNESDEYERELDKSFSTFSRMTVEVAELLFEELSQNSARGVLLCGREFVYPCFRAAITHVVSGDEMMNAFVEWYQNNVELNDLARIDMARIVIFPAEGSFRIEDSFGNLSFNLYQLQSLYERSVLQSGAAGLRS